MLQYRTQAGCSSPFPWPLSPQVDTTKVCDAWPVRCQTKFLENNFSFSNSAVHQKILFYSPIFTFISEVLSTLLYTEPYLFGGQSSLVLAIDVSICSFHSLASSSVQTSNSSRSNFAGRFSPVENSTPLSTVHHCQYISFRLFYRKENVKHPCCIRFFIDLCNSV